jgi:hypothetical protein
MATTMVDEIQGSNPRHGKLVAVWQDQKEQHMLQP